MDTYTKMKVATCTPITLTLMTSMKKTTRLNITTPAQQKTRQHKTETLCALKTNLNSLKDNKVKMASGREIATTKKTVCGKPCLNQAILTLLSLNKHPPKKKLI
jgi:hypothetical protein